MNEFLKAQQIEILNEVLTKNTAQLAKELQAGNRNAAHVCVELIIDAQRDLEDLGARPQAGTHEANFTA